MHRRTWILASLALVALQLALALRIAPYQIDDAAIGFRYAANFAAGRGLTYNPGSPPVEGFTNPAWVLALSVIARIGAPAWLPAASMLLGLLCALACVGVAAWIGVRMTGEARGALPAAAVLA